MDIEEKVETLREYSEWEGTELGELWNWLIELWERYRAYSSDGFVAALEGEISAHYDQVKMNASLETTERVVPEHKETVTELVWKNQ